jgi:hypothetical protein
MSAVRNADKKSAVGNADKMSVVRYFLMVRFLP